MALELAQRRATRPPGLAAVDHDQEDLSGGRDADRRSRLTGARDADGRLSPVEEQDRIAADRVEHTRPPQRPVQTHGRAGGEGEEHLGLVGPRRGRDHDTSVAVERRLGARRHVDGVVAVDAVRGGDLRGPLRQKANRTRERRRRRERSSHRREADDLARLGRAPIPSIQGEHPAVGLIGDVDLELGVAEERGRLVLADGEHLRIGAGGMQEVAVLRERVDRVAEPLAGIAVHTGERVVVPHDPRQLPPRRQGVVRDRGVQRDGLRQVDLQHERSERDLPPHDPDVLQARGDLPRLHDGGSCAVRRPTCPGVLRRAEREHQERGSGQGDWQADGRVHRFHDGTS